jgi:hypothetical protein
VKRLHISNYLLYLNEFYFILPIKAGHPMGEILPAGLYYNIDLTSLFIFNLDLPFQIKKLDHRVKGTPLVWTGTAPVFMQVPQAPL